MDLCVCSTSRTTHKDFIQTLSFHSTMNAPNSSPASSDTHSAEAWGYTHPECRGASSFLFFTSDLARVVNQELAGQPLNAVALAKAQSAVNVLIQRYIDIEAAPAAFVGQRITLRLDTSDPNGTPHVALEMSPELEDQIIEAQRIAHQQAAIGQ